VSGSGDATVRNVTFESPSGTANTQPFRAGDVITSKQFYMRDNTQNTRTTGAAARIAWAVGTVGTLPVGSPYNVIPVTFQESTYDTPLDTMAFVRVGSSDSTRQGLIVMSSDGIEQGATADVPFFDVYDNLTSISDFLAAMGGNTTYTKVRIGRLDAITGGTDQFGLWTNNIFIQGNSGAGANGIYYQSGEPSGSDFNLGDLWIDSDTIAAGISGKLYFAPVPAGDPGLYIGSDHLGYYGNVDGGGNDWYTYMNNSGDFFLRGSGGDNFQWVASNAALTIGDSGLADARIVFGAAAADVEFYDQAGLNVFNLESNIDGIGHGGLNLFDDGIVYMHSLTNRGASGIHIEVSNEDDGNQKGAITGHVADDDSTAIVNPTLGWVGVKGTAKTTGGTQKPIGIYGHAVNTGTTNRQVFAGRFRGIGTTGDTVFGGYFEATGGANNWAIYAEDGSVKINSGNMYLGGGSLYFDSGDGERCYWDGSRFRFTDGVQMAELVMNGTLTGATEITTSGDMNVGADIRLTKSGASTIYFDAGTEYLTWNNGATRFEFSDDLYISKALLVTTSIGGASVHSTGNINTETTFSIGGAIGVQESSGRWSFDQQVDAPVINVKSGGAFKANGTSGITSSGFVIAVGDTISVKGGIITALSH